MNDPRVNLTGSIGVGKIYRDTNVYILVAIADTLPTPDESWYRKFLILQGTDSDELYICMRVKGVYEWVGFNNATGVDETTSELGKAILNKMILK